MKFKYILPLFALLTIMGQGCLPGSDDSMMESDKKDDSMMMEDKMEKDGDSMMKDDSMMMDDSAMAEIDDTWETYQNDALGFGFQWPTRGRYAPTWELVYPKDEEIANDCYMTLAASSHQGSFTNSDGITFCTETVFEEGTDENIYKDFFTTKKNGLNIVLKTEKVYSADAGATVSREDYQAVLNTMLESFAFDEE